MSPATAANDTSGRNSCLLMLVIYAVLTTVYTLVLQTVVTAYALPLALALAVFGSLFVGSLVSVVVFPDETRWVREAQRGHRPRTRDLCAICGRVGGDAEPAPISGEPALAWDLEVYDRRYSSIQKQTRKVLKYKGMGRVPIVVEGATGQVRLHGLLEIDQVAAQTTTAEKVMPELEALTEDPSMQAFSLRWKGVTGHLEEFQTDDSSYRKLRHDPKVKLRPTYPVEERILRPGDEVCALGVFDREANALRGRSSLGVARIQILPGSPGRVLARLRRRTWVGLAAMTALFLASHGLIAAVLFWNR
ncbi:MAG: hypothetical protein AAGC60_30225 [Acidobacteriota bacterium]